MSIATLNDDSVWLQSKISKTPGVCGGVACVRQTRIPVWLLVSYRRLGATEPELLVNFPSLCQDDLIAAWEYFAASPSEIEADLAAQEAADLDG